MLLGLAIGAYGWDASKGDEIASGIRIGSLDVGGLDEREARRLLRQELLEPLEPPIRVAVAGRKFTVSPAELDVSVEVRGAVEEALAASRDGGLPTRVWRYAIGAEVERKIDPQLSYSHSALERFIEEVAASVARPPRDATISPTVTSLNPVPARSGRELRREQLRRRLEQALVDPESPRTVGGTAERIQPEVTTDELAAQYPTYITIDRASFTLRFFRNLKLAESYTIAVGQQGYATPAGLHAIESKQVNPTWYVPDEPWAGRLAGRVVPPGPDNPLQARWLGFAGAAGIHGTNDVASLGSAASHGCIRMAVPDVIELYDRVTVGTPVYIE